MVTKNIKKNGCQSSNDIYIAKQVKRLPWCSSGCPHKRVGSYCYRPDISGEWHKKNASGRVINKRKLKIWIFLIIIVGLFAVRSEVKQTFTDDECCYKMKQLTAALLRTEVSLRKTRRQHSLLLTTQTAKLEESRPEYIERAVASKGRETEEWSGRAALWGVVPLWRSSPPAATVLSARPPAPGDCWPFSGPSGEVIISFPHPRTVSMLSVEHTRPDAANSAPRQFETYGILKNGTWFKIASGEYTYFGPARQHYTFKEVVNAEQLVFRVLSNHGNAKYTCLYRISFY